MVNWNEIAETAMIYWQEFVSWFLSIPLYGQVLVVIGIAAVLILAGVLVYYMLKGVAYLIYYILKGVYLLLKGIGILFYKLFQAIYYAISGKPRPVKQEEQEQVSPQIKEDIKPQYVEPVQQEFFNIKPNAAYCSECGAEFSDRMQHQLAERGMAYCVHCGKGFKSIKAEIEQY